MQIPLLPHSGSPDAPPKDTHLVPLTNLEMLFDNHVSRVERLPRDLPLRKEKRLP